MRDALNPIDPAPNPFVGREAELARLQKALADAVAGRGRVVMLVGDPGIGKTRMAEDLAAAAKALGAEVLVGRCHESQGSPAYWPWQQIVRAYLRGKDNARVADDLGEGAPEVARMVGELRRRLPDLPTPPENLEREESRFRLFDAFTQFLAASAARQPLMLVLDDLHWADLSSLQLLQFLAREMSATPMLIVGTYREAEVKQDEARAEVLGSLSRERLYERLALRGLSSDETRSLLTSLVGSSPPGELVERLRQRTDGNPFFLTELTRHLREQGLLDGYSQQVRPGDTLAVPESVHAIVSQRARGLRPETRKLLQDASVIGRDFDLTVLARLAKTDEVGILRGLDEAAAGGLLQALDAGSTQVRFAHALVRDALYGGLAADERAATHRQLAEVLESHWGLELDDHAGELAMHFSAGAHPADIDKVIEFAARAAARAMSQLAYEDVTQSCEIALQALARLQPPDGVRTCRILLALGEAQAAVSDVNQVRQTYLRAVELARQVGDTQSLAEAAVGYARVPVVDGVVDARAIQMLEEALATLTEADSPLRAHALSMLACSLQYAPRTYERRAALCREALAMARRIGDPRALARTLYDQRTALFAPENLDERFAAANELLQLAEQTGDRPMLMRARYCRVIDLIELGRLDDADIEISALARLADELREPWHHWYAAWFRATRAIMSGRFAEGEDLAQRAYSYGDRVSPETALQVLGVQITMLRALQGRWSEMVPAIRNTVEAFPAIAGWRCALAQHCAELDDADEAGRHFDILAANEFADIPRDRSWLVSMSQLVDVCCYLKDQSRAALLYELLAPFADRLMVVNAGLASCGVGSRYLGILATTLQRWEEAESHTQRAIEFQRRAGMWPWVAMTLYDFAEMLVARSGDSIPDSARRSLDEAGELAARLGMARVTTKVEALRARIADHAAVEPAESAHIEEPIRGTLHGERESAFVNEGDVWMIAYDGKTCRLKDARGLQYLVLLLRNPGRQFHVTELLALAGGVTPGDGAFDDGIALGGGRDALPQLDQQAQRAYRARLIELQEELADAERCNDLGAIERARAELDMLAQELSGSVRSSTAGERARASITKRVKASLAKIQEAHPTLGRHLQATVKTGYFCSYAADERQAAGWRT